ncbi:MAG: hypothetical protein A2Y64_07595 [Candidatus Coatesbacteria bacterium RBG_13_66_14]|uniref:PsbP C-terminal domain-containing protein n=1 Tax=Candidatus Coatesbacteria bacterium RBG_13_66_14 TaxID=1817816 RepID=A0A1F5EWC3_9BACT|nr:MAG: hypothetical protein A2Y64_07595 [Candidatus Coatesbacteria bacterium RBG_13_66_14]
MRKALLILSALVLAASATTTGGGATGPTFSATIGGVAVDVVLPNEDWSKGTVSLNKFTINGPSSVIITVTPLTSAVGLDTTDMDALCKDKLAEKANAATTGTKVVVDKNSAGVTYALRSYESGGNVYFVGVSGTGTCGVMFYAKVPTAQKTSVQNALKSILGVVALSK